MRSRYSAYALGNHGQFLYDTWHPSMSAKLSAEQLSIVNYQWFKLEVLNKTQNGDEATVEFKAHYFSSDGQQHVLHENSYFQRVAGKWLYVGVSQ